MFKSGFVNIIGKPNVGKSSLLNALLGEKLCIISPKVQTTRHRIKAFYTTDTMQIIFSDTPGILDPKYKLQECMKEFIDEALEDADIIIYLTTVEENVEIPNFLINAEVPVILVINKIDLLKNQQELEHLVSEWKKKLPHAPIVAISALLRANLDTLMKVIEELLPEHPPYFNSEELSDKNIRFFVSEFIREKIFLLYKQEIPYSTEVVIDSFIEEENLTKIFATIYVLRESQKAIIIGEKGKAIKELGIEARQEIEKFLQTKVYLELRVKVLKNWRNDIKWLKRLGYIQK
ncbi:MAG: GTPase Era [Bacteroidales bacterium]|nr:GTPase Era [Bacteroidales bacterium]